MKVPFTKILTPSQIKDWDAYTLETEQIESIYLMERAAQEFAYWFNTIHPFYRSAQRVLVVCGTGNNGGDGFAVARILHSWNIDVQVIHCQTSDNWSADCAINREHLQELDIPLKDLRPEDKFPNLQDYDMMIDALFGVGLNRPIEGYWAAWIEYLNQQSFKKVALDIPSGLFAHETSTGAIIKANHTGSFQVPKLAFFLPENQNYVGDWHLIDIGLSPSFLPTITSPYYVVNKSNVFHLLKKRNKHAHKGTFGHALLVAGSYGKMGAAVLAAKAILKIGAGLVTVQVPKCGYAILQIAFPEAMVVTDEHEEYFTKATDLQAFRTIGIGPGLGTALATGEGLKDLLEQATHPLVLDADALNLLAQHKDWLTKLPKGSILTPHPKEFERLFGATHNDFERLELLKAKAKSLAINIVLKGAYTCTATPLGDLYFNTSGNSGMATAGMGDVLTGVLTGLVAQGYEPNEACVLGVYLHGLAADLAIKESSRESLIASDVIEYLGKAFFDVRDHDITWF